MSDEALPLPVEVPGGDASLAILLRIADAVEKVARSSEDAGKKGEEAGRKQISAWDRASGAMEAAADRAKVLAERYQYITQAIDSIAEKVEAIGALAEEQERLDLITERLGVSMDEAAAAGGRFVDEVDPMAAAGELLTRRVHATQEEMNALVRVAASASVMMGTTTAQATQQLSDAIISGRARALAPFGAELEATAGHAGSLGERLAALVVVAGHTAQASDTSRDAVKRLRDQVDDYKRVAATAFMHETERLLSLGGATHTTAEDMRTLTDTVGGVASAIATMASMVIGSIRLLVTEAGSEISRFGNFIGLVSNETNAAWTHMRDDALDNLEGQYADRNGENPNATILRGGTLRTPVNVSGGARVDTRLDRYHEDQVIDRTTRGEVTTDTARSLRAGVSYQPQNDAERRMMAAREEEAVARDHRDPSEDNAAARAAASAQARATHAGESAAARAAREAEAAARAEAERQNRTIEESMRDAHRAADALRGQNPNAERGGFMQRVLAPGETDATTQEQKRRDREAGEDAAFASSDEGRGIAQQRERNAQRERREQDQRLASMRSFTDQFEDMHQRRVTATQMEAEAVTQAFSAMGTAMSKHFQLWREGKEALGEALQGMLADTLTSIGKEASVKGGMQLAEGAANLIIAPPLAAQNFIAAGLYFGVAGLAGAAGSALAPPSASSGAGDRSGGRTAALPASTGDARTGGNVYTWNNYAPTFGGRNGSRAEVGEQIGRYTTADEERTRRAA